MSTINYTFKKIFSSDSDQKSIKFDSLFKYLPQKGNMVYEYNPFRNYRLTENKYFYKNKFYSEQELINQENIISDVFTVKDTQKTYRLNPTNKNGEGIIISDKYTFAPYNSATQNYTYNIKSVFPGSTHSGQFKLVKSTTDQFAFQAISGKESGKYIDLGTQLTLQENPVYYPATSTAVELSTIKDKITFSQNATNYYNINTWQKIEGIELYPAGSCVDFITDELQFDMEHPVDMIPQYSYDGSVNLFINDGKNTPKLINSRFSATGKNTYQIVDRKGDNDTNLYNQGQTFNSDISLYNSTSTISTIEYLGTFEGGQLPCGNYHFYFTYSDADGNETDFFAETGVISIFIGNTSSSLRQGIRNESSGKGIKLLIKNLDPHYCYLNVYYSKATGDLYQNSEKVVMKLSDRIFVSNVKEQLLTITGFEATIQITEADINPVYSYVKSAYTQCFNSNILFMGNVKKTELNYNELSDISLHFLPYLNTSKKYNLGKSKSYTYDANSYQSSKFIYNFTGYWPDELYRIGIVYILNDTSLSPVFNIRGKYNIHEYYEGQYTKINYYDSNGNRQYIEIDQNTNLLTQGQHNQLENAKGVVHFTSELNGESNAQIYGIDIRVDDKNIFEYLKQHTKGFFFVRQRRLPTTLCQGQSVGVDPCNHHITMYTDQDNEIEESFLDDNTRYLSHDFDKHIRKAINPEYSALLCPDYDVNYPYLNNIFNGQNFTLVKSDFQPTDFVRQDRHFWNQRFLPNSFRKVRDNIQILGVEDSTPLVNCGDKLFSALAGIPQMGYKFDFINSKTLTTESTNFLRGLWGPFLGLNQEVDRRTLYDIKIPNFNKDNMSDYFQIRMQDKSAYYAISDRIDISNISTKLGTFYRGDCYICKFTHRVNRNFNDDSAPYNSIIVNNKTWIGKNNGGNEDEEDKRGFKVEDGVIKYDQFQHINLADINAVGLGMWVNICLRSSINLNIRALDEQDVNQVARTGHPKGFYPYFPITIDGSYKHPESLSYNKGYEVSVSTRYNYEQPDIPAEKTNFTNRIVYSNLSSSDAYVNGNRVFKANNFQDYSQIYGGLTKIVPYNNSIVAIFEHGIILLQVNERALLNEQGNIYIASNKVISQNPVRVLSDTYGSQWKDSIIKTPYGLYGVDTVAKKIWKTNGEAIECISDYKVQKYLNDNISLTERETTPIIGIRNVKTHYNQFKNDVMFTFYDNLNSVHEKVWNLCWNENFGEFITFYSWLPSYSENIQNQYFSFDRQTSKWISRLGECSPFSSYKGMLSLSNVIIPNDQQKEYTFAELLFNFDYSTIDSVRIIRDSLRNDTKFTIIKQYDNLEGKNRWYLKLKEDITEYYSELFERIDIDNNGKKCNLSNKIDRDRWKEAIKSGKPWEISKLSTGQRVRLQADSDQDLRINPDKIVYYINIEVTYKVNDVSYTIQRQVYCIPKYNMQFLTTDFWKHGQAGIIDIADDVYPTYWYGKQHPFEFEFIVNRAQTSHKIFDNLILIANKAEPDSFHYEIVGETYDFAEDKPNIYFRQEASKAFYQYHGLDIEYDTDFSKTQSFLNHKPLYTFGVNEKDEEAILPIEEGKYVKSTVFPLFFYRRKGYDEIEDYYKQSTAKAKNYDGKSGTEITYDDTLNEYHLWEHVKAVNIKDAGRRLRSNMEYKENMWNVQIPPINLQQKDEEDWNNDVPPILTSNVPVQQPVQLEISTDDLFPNELYKLGYKDIKNLDQEQWEYNKQIRLKDRYLKVRVRYSGKDLAIVQSVITLFRISYA